MALLHLLKQIGVARPPAKVPLLLGRPTTNPKLTFDEIAKKLGVDSAKPEMEKRGKPNARKFLSASENDPMANIKRS